MIIFNARFKHLVEKLKCGQLCRLLLTPLALLGCSPAYHAASSGGSGYADAQITERIFKVTFNGGLTLDSVTTESYALYRAAELVLENGFEAFRVIKSEILPVQIRQNAPYLVTDRSLKRSVHGQFVVSAPGDWQTFTAHLTLEAIKEPLEISRADLYNAREVLKYLEKSIEKRGA